jgi:hypothetical protein
MSVLTCRQLAAHAVHPVNHKPRLIRGIARDVAPRRGRLDLRLQRGGECPAHHATVGRDPDPPFGGRSTLVDEHPETVKRRTTERQSGPAPSVSITEGLTDSNGEELLHERRG